MSKIQSTQEKQKDLELRMDTSSLSIQNVTNNDDGEYTCKIKVKELGRVISKKYQLKVVCKYKYIV